jgi:predicted component of viral defense system (DUF524 family)
MLNFSQLLKRGIGTMKLRRTYESKLPAEDWAIADNGQMTAERFFEVLEGEAAKKTRADLKALEKHIVELRAELSDLENEAQRLETASTSVHDLAEAKHAEDIWQVAVLRMRGKQKELSEALAIMRELKGSLIGLVEERVFGRLRVSFTHGDPLMIRLFISL